MRLGKTGVVRRGWSGCTRLLDSLPDLFGTTARPARAYVLGRSAVAASLRTEARAQSHPWLCSEDISPRMPVLVTDSLTLLRVALFEAAHGTPAPKSRNHWIAGIARAPFPHRAHNNARIGNDPLSGAAWSRACQPRTPHRRPPGRGTSTRCRGTSRTWKCFPATRRLVRFARGAARNPRCDRPCRWRSPRLSNAPGPGDASHRST